MQPIIKLSQNVQISPEDPAVKKVFSYLDILYLWCQVHDSILERNKTKKYMLYTNIALNPGYL